MPRQHLPKDPRLETRTTTGECVDESGEPCSSRAVVHAIQSFVIDVAAGAGASPKQAIGLAAAALNCDSESCILTHPDFRQYVVDTRALDRDLEVRFKPVGPRDSTALLSNFNIDDTLRRWARAFPEFYPCPFAMMDFDRNGDQFGSIDLAQLLAAAGGAAAECFGCVINTDVSSGPGKHWVAVFVDGRPAAAAPWTVEYFNSSGNPPPRAMVHWMERARAGLAAARGGPVRSLPVTDVDHQESRTECGVYALYYIRRRLEGTPPEFFTRNVVPDADMVAFRKHLFRK